MKTWLARSKEEAYLFNPAFCCITLSVAMRGYASVRDGGLPFRLAFMLLPIVLHKPTRESLPRDTRTSMAAWLQANSEARVLFYERLVSLKPHTRGKHLVLRRYLDAWFPIMASSNRRVLFVDGFAGPGEYKGGEEGSPLIALRAVQEHAAKNSFKADIKFLVIEADADHAVTVSVGACQGSVDPGFTKGLIRQPMRISVAAEFNFRVH